VKEVTQDVNFFTINLQYHSVNINSKAARVLPFVRALNNNDLLTMLEIRE